MVVITGICNLAYVRLGAYADKRAAR